MSETERPKAEHPRTYLALMSRTRLIGTLNVALAVRGKSSGWGLRERPRRTFFGLYRLGAPPFHRGIEVILNSDPGRRGMGTERVLLRIPLGSGKTAWRFSRKPPAPAPAGDSGGERG